MKDIRDRIAEIISDCYSEFTTYKEIADKVLSLISETHISLDTEVKGWERVDKCKGGFILPPRHPATVRDFIEGKEVRKKNEY